VDCVLVVTIEQKEVVAGTADQRLVGVASDVAEPRIYLLEPKTKMVFVYRIGTYVMTKM